MAGAAHETSLRARSTLRMYFLQPISILGYLIYLLFIEGDCSSLEGRLCFCLHRAWLVQMKALTTGCMHEGCKVIVWYTGTALFIATYPIIFSLAPFSRFSQIGNEPNRENHCNAANHGVKCIWPYRAGSALR